MTKQPANSNCPMQSSNSCTTPVVSCETSGCVASDLSNPFAWFDNMIMNCLQYAQQSKAEGKPVIGVMCEYTPRELIMASGAVPVCLCGGSAATIPAAEEHLPSNLCPLIKSTYGYFVQKSNPFIEMADLIVAETTCDGKKKMYELMAESKPMYVLELPQKENDPDAFAHWVRELAKFKEFLERRYNVNITEERIKDAILTMNRERALRRTLASFMKLDAPPLTGRELLKLKSSIAGVPCDLKQYENAITMLSARPLGCNCKKRVRVLMTGVPMVHGAERVLEIIEERGGLVVCMENCTGLKPIIDDVEVSGQDAIHALADKYYTMPCSIKTPNTGRTESLRRLAKEYRPDCIIDLVWQACITYDVESYKIKRFAENELRMPYLRIETDYSPSDSARIAVRVEALFETIRSNCSAKCGET